MIHNESLNFTKQSEDVRFESFDFDKASLKSFEQMQIKYLSEESGEEPDQDKHFINKVN